MRTNKISVTTGKYYRTRNNYKVRILTTDRKHNYPAVGLLDCKGVDELHSWSLEGRWFSSTSENDLDLVCEWYEPPVIDWPAMPAWARYVAQNEDGSWWWFTQAPERVSDVVTHDNGGKIEDERGVLTDGERIPEKYAPIYSGPWEDSLVERPAESD